MLIKQQWIGRFVPIDNSHIRDFDRWFVHIKEIYDERISLEFIDSFLCTKSEPVFV